MNAGPRIALISAVTAAIPPAQDALRRVLPDAALWNILDDRLLADADARGGLDDDLRARMRRLIAHAVAEHADAVLLTCSLYGPVAAATTLEAAIPVLSPDEAAFSDIAAAGYGSVLVVASFDGARDDSVARLLEALRAAGSDTTVTGVSVAAAMEATRAQDHAALVTALIEGTRAEAADVDAVFLAQYSLAPARDDVESALGVPVLSGPTSSATALQRLLAGKGEGGVA